MTPTRRVLTATALVPLLLLALANPSHAAKSWRDCPKGYTASNVRLTYDVSMPVRSGRLCIYNVDRRKGLWKLRVWVPAGQTTRLVR